MWEPDTWGEPAPPSLLELYRGHLAANGVELPTDDVDDDQGGES